MTDPELAAIARELRATAHYAVDPQFKEQLRKELLAQFKRRMNVHSEKEER